MSEPNPNYCIKCQDGQASTDWCGVTRETLLAATVPFHQKEVPCCGHPFGAHPSEKQLQQQLHAAMGDLSIEQKPKCTCNDGKDPCDLNRQQIRDRSLSVQLTCTAGKSDAHCASCGKHQDVHARTPGGPPEREVDLDEFNSMLADDQQVDYHLLNGVFSDREESQQAFLDAVRALSVSVAQRKADKKDLKLIGTCGPSGAGKTALLREIAKGIWDDAIISEASTVIAETTPTSPRRFTSVKHFFATFGQTSQFEEDEVCGGGTIQIAAVSRLNAFSARKVRHNRPRKALPQALHTLQSFVDHHRQDKRDCIITLLFDELVQLSPEHRRHLLNLASAVQQRDASSGMLTIVVGTSLDVDVFQKHMTDSQRPVHVMPLPSLSLDTLEVIAEREFDNRPHEYRGGKRSVEQLAESRMRFRSDLSFTGGHPGFVRYFLDHRALNQPVGLCEDLVAAVMDVFMKSVCDLAQADSVAVKFGQDERGQGGVTVGALVKYNLVVYSAITSETASVKLRVMPYVLRYIATTDATLQYIEKRYPREAVLLKELFSTLLTPTFLALTKSWELSMLQVEELRIRAFQHFKCAAKLSDILPKVECALDLVARVGNVHVEHVDGTSQLVVDESRIQRVTFSNSGNGGTESFSTFYQTCDGKVVGRFEQMKLRNSKDNNNPAAGALGACLSKMDEDVLQAMPRPCVAMFAVYHYRKDPEPVNIGQQYMLCGAQTVIEMYRPLGLLPLLLVTSEK